MAFLKRLAKLTGALLKELIRNQIQIQGIGDLVTKIQGKYYSVWVSFCPRAVWVVWVSFCPRGSISLTPITTVLSTGNTTSESNGL